MSNEIDDLLKEPAKMCVEKRSPEFNTVIDGAVERAWAIIDGQKAMALLARCRPYVIEKLKFEIDKFLKKGESL